MLYMKNTIYKKRWKRPTPYVFTEFGLDPDNNRFFLGISSEIEHFDGTETRYSGFTHMHIRELYLRIWMFRMELSIGTGEIEFCRKSRFNLKILFGFAGTLGKRRRL